MRVLSNSKALTWTFILILVYFSKYTSIFLVFKYLYILQISYYFHLTPL